MSCRRSRASAPSRPGAAADRAPSRPVYRHILVPIDGSRLSEDAARAAMGVAQAFGARVTVLHVVARPAAPVLDAWTHHDAQFEAHLEKVLEARGREYLESVCELA